MGLGSRGREGVETRHTLPPFDPPQRLPSTPARKVAKNQLPIMRAATGRGEGMSKDGQFVLLAVSHSSLILCHFHRRAVVYELWVATKNMAWYAMWRPKGRLLHWRDCEAPSPTISM